MPWMRFATQGLLLLGALSMGSCATLELTSPFVSSTSEETEASTEARDPRAAPKANAAGRAIRVRVTHEGIAKQLARALIDHPQANARVQLVASHEDADFVLRARVVSFEGDEKTDRRSEIGPSRRRRVCYSSSGYVDLDMAFVITDRTRGHHIEQLHLHERVEKRASQLDRRPTAARPDTLIIEAHKRIATRLLRRLGASTRLATLVARRDRDRAAAAEAASPSN